MEEVCDIVTANIQGGLWGYYWSYLIVRLFQNHIALSSAFVFLKFILRPVTLNNPVKAYCAPSQLENKLIQLEKIIHLFPM